MLGPIRDSVIEQGEGVRRRERVLVASSARLEGKRRGQILTYDI
jgi:hypothetical protein